MSKNINVAILDSGSSLNTFEKIAIEIDKNKKVKIGQQKSLKFNHGEVITSIINESNVNIYDIQIFNDELRTTPLHIYYALNYLIEKDIDVINLSLGITQNYKEIEEVCNKLMNKGVTIISSYPRRSEVQIFPTSYKGVIKVTSEGMCKDDKVVSLDENMEYFGANPFSLKKEVAGSSVSVAKFTKEFCSYLKKGLKKEEILEKFSKRKVNEPY